VTTQERTLTVLGVVALVGILGAAAALALGGGDSGRAVSTAPASTLVTTSSTAPVTSTTAAPAPAPSGSTGGQTTVTVGIICSNAEEASTSLVDAWLASNQSAAKRCASDAAVATMFQTSGAGAAYTSQGCDRTDPGVPICSYSYEGGAVRLKIEGTEAAGWKVTNVSYIAD
jgi:hypothetical protein